ARVTAVEGGGQVVGEHTARDILGDGSAGVKDLGVAEAILRAEQGRDHRLELATQKARRAEAVRLEDGNHPGGSRLRRGDGRANVLAVVGVVVHDVNVARGRADQLEAARDDGDKEVQVRQRDGVTLRHAIDQYTDCDVSL